MNAIIQELVGGPSSDLVGLRKRAAARIEELEETLASIVRHAEKADDPEHHTLGLIKHIAANALKQPQ